MSAPRKPQGTPRRALAAALALLLSFETGTARAAPSERDLAYERGVQADEAGDHARAAVEFARAYHLTPPGETGPRLLFLRASVDARRRARDRGGDPREHLCPARALLREHLAGAAPAAGPDPLADERASLARIDQELGGIDCDAEPAAARPVSGDSSPPPGPSSASPVSGDSSPPPGPSSASPVSGDSSTTSPAASPARPSASAPPVSGDSSRAIRPVPGDIYPAPGPRPPDLRRSLRIAGATSLGLGAAALVPMSVGIALARAATRRGRGACWSTEVACDGSDLDIDEIRREGERADLIVKISAPLAATALLAGAISLGLGLRGRARPAALAPRLGPGAAGFTLQGRF